jgi:1-acyl-sn-glycerol-3-phosphate acyltransferase
MKLINGILNKFNTKHDKERFDQVFEHLYKVYPDGVDPWGLNLKKARKSIEFIWPVYKHYFKTRIFGKENVQDEAYMIVSNHSGQIAIDGVLISTAFAMEIDPPRILRSMVERFFTGIPFVGYWAAEGGAVLGDRQNCLNLLKKNQSVLVFPEGVRGVSKSTPDFYKVQPFTKGFYRLARNAKVKILPIGVVGAEEFYPMVYQAHGVAKSLGLPALPISPNLVPLPSPVDIHIGKPYEIPADIDQSASEEVINKEVIKVTNMIKDLVENGLKQRREFWGTSKNGNIK